MRFPVKLPLYILRHRCDLLFDLANEGAHKYPEIVKNYKELGRWYVENEQKNYCEIRKTFTSGLGYSFQAWSRGIMSSVWGPCDGLVGHTEQQVYEAIGHQLLEREGDDINAIDVETLDRYILNLTQARDKLVKC